MSHILLVEDDESLILPLKEFLAAEGFSVTSASGQKDAVILLNKDFDLLLLDIALSDGDGFAICRIAKEMHLPVIFLTASGDENSVVKGLDMGADDYISKPFRPRELVSRINSVIRRSSGIKPAIKIGSCILDTDKGIVTKDGEEVSFSAMEYRLLTEFINNRGRILSRNSLLENIWDIAGDYVNDNTLTVYIKRVREKIEDDPQDPQIIKTIRGLGYRMD